MNPAKPKRKTVGVVGLGIMGGSFARNLVADGWRVVGYDISPARRRLSSPACPSPRH
jgi:putative dehydrogenase